MVVASTNVSTPLGVTSASAEMASCYMKMAMTVKKVRSLLPALRKDKLPEVLFEPRHLLPSVETIFIQCARLEHQKSPS